jgi:hypothetical protein
MIIYDQGSCQLYNNRYESILWCGKVPKLHDDGEILIKRK